MPARTPDQIVPRQVFDALRHDFNTRRRERCVRLDFPVQQGQGSIAGLEELEQLLKAAIKASFETQIMHKKRCMLNPLHADAALLMLHMLPVLSCPILAGGARWQR